MIYDLPTQDNFVRAWQSGAMSAAAFCRLHDLPYQTFLLWRRRLAAGSSQRASVAFVELVSSESDATPSFPAASPGVGLLHLHSADARPPTVQVTAPALVAELVLPGGLLLRFFQPNSTPNSTPIAPAAC